MDLYKLPEIQKLKDQFAFTYEKDKEDKYFCRCGESWGTTIDPDSKIENITDIVEEDQQEYLEEFEHMFNDVKRAIVQGTTCPKCKINYVHPIHKRFLARKNEVFADGYLMDSDKERLSIYHYQTEFIEDEEKGYELKVEYKKLAFNKENENVFYQSIGEDEFEVDLCDVIVVIQDFFATQTKYTISLHELHHFINSISNFIPDSDSIAIMEEVIRKVQSKKEIGFEPIKEIFSIFIALRLYSNLSTIAITKGPNFLYEIMLKCHLPTLEKIKEANVTAPIPIFNFLIQNYIDRVNDDLAGEDRSTKDFIYKSDVEIENLHSENKKEEDLKISVKKGEERQMTIKVRNQKAYEKALQIARAQRGQKKGGDINVKEKIVDGSISKFIFNKIDTFKDYERLIRYFKFVDKQGLIALMQKWPKDFLVAVIDRIYHRRDCDEREMKQIFNLIHSFVDMESKKNAEVDEEGRIIDKLNYDLVEDFDFAYYDDAIMAIEYLYRVVDEDMKHHFVKSKHFNKIKDYERLIKFHNSIITKQNYYAKEEEGEVGALEEVVEKYRWLEDREGYDGPVRVKILDNFDAFVREGEEMDHSAGQYAHKTLDEEMIICKLVLDRPRVNPEEKLRFTLGLLIDYYDGLVFDQLKGYQNEHASDRAIKEVREWLEHKEISIRRITDIKYMGDDTLDLDEIEL